jgi:hypothetical protein
MTEVVFTRTDHRLGGFALRPVRPEADALLLHSWLTHPKSRFWLMQDAGLADIEAEQRAIAASPSRTALLGLHQGTPAFLMECYDPARSEIAEVYAVRPGDAGMHVVVAPTEKPVRGFTGAVFLTVMDLLFAEHWTRRVVVEPDVRNTAVHRLNAAVGFRIADTVTLPDKTAYLGLCTRAQYAAARPALLAASAETRSEEEKA